MKKVLLAANFGPVHVGSHLAKGADALGIPLVKVNALEAYDAPWWLRQWCWRVRGKIPPKLSKFQRSILHQFHQSQAQVVITTGLSPLTKATIQSMKRAGATVVNYSTDDPWNPAHKAQWFLDVLPAYDLVLSTRRANLDEFRQAGVKRVEWMPFGYAPDMHFPWEGGAVNDDDSDVGFYGNVDADRIPLLEHIVNAGLRLALHTANRVPVSLRASWRGYADAPAMRRLMAQSTVALVIGRKANRDGHAMRSYEAPAMRGCLIVEDTQEHREMYGAEGEAVLYYTNPDELVMKTRQLLQAGREKRQTLRHAAWERITKNNNTYADRLSEMILCCTP